jgi:hypothetical protein
MDDEQQTLTLDEALALLEKHESEADVGAVAEEKKKKIKEKEKVKDLILEGAKQGRSGLGTNFQRMYEEVED